MFPMHIFTNTTQMTSPPLSILNMSKASSDINYQISDSISRIMQESYEVSIEHMKDTYSYLKYGDSYILEATMNTFINNVNHLLNSLKNIVRSFVRKTISYDLSRATEFEKFLKTNKNEISKINRTITLNNGYEYTIPEKNSPNIEILDDFIYDFNDTISDPTKITKEYISKESNKFNYSYKDKTRAKILGKKGEIESSDFIREIRKFYRDGDSEPKKIRFTGTDIKDLPKAYSIYKRLLMTTRDESDTILDGLEKISKLFNMKVTVSNNKKDISVQNISRSGKSGTVTVNYDETLLNNLNEYYHLQYQKVSFLYTCVINVYFEKINAIREYLLQTEKIIKFALSDSVDSVITDEINEVVAYD